MVSPTVRTRAVAALMCVVSALSACAEPEVIRSTEGVLTLAGEYPSAINAMRVDGTLVARDGCLIFRQENGAIFQPIFPQGVTLERLNQKLGSLARPQGVMLGGFDAGGSLPLAVATSAITKRCPGAPFIFGSIEPCADRRVDHTERSGDRAGAAANSTKPNPPSLPVSCAAITARKAADLLNAY